MVLFQRLVLIIGYESKCKTWGTTDFSLFLAFIIPLLGYSILTHTQLFWYVVACRWFGSVKQLSRQETPNIVGGVNRSCIIMMMMLMLRMMLMMMVMVMMMVWWWWGGGWWGGWWWWCWWWWWWWWYCWWWWCCWWWWWWWYDDVVVDDDDDADDDEEEESLRSRNAHGHSQEPFCIEIYREKFDAPTGDIVLWTAGLNNYRKDPSVRLHCLGKKRILKSPQISRPSIKMGKWGPNDIRSIPSLAGQVYIYIYTYT